MRYVVKSTPKGEWRVIDTKDDSPVILAGNFLREHVGNRSVAEGYATLLNAAVDRFKAREGQPHG